MNARIPESVTQNPATPPLPSSPGIPVRHQTVRPLCALVTIFVVVFVFGVAIGIAQSFSQDSNSEIARAELTDSTPAEGASLTAGSAQPID